jgi:hypothetical protein
MGPLQPWQQEREQTNRRVEALRQEGVCPTRYDLQTGGQLYGNEYLVYEDELFKVALECYARASGRLEITTPVDQPLCLLYPLHMGGMRQGRRGWIP